MASFLIKLGTYTFLGAVKTWVEDLPTKLRPVDVPRRHGQVLIEEPTVGSRRIVLTGNYKGATVTATRTLLDNLQNALYSSTEQKLYLHDDRYIWVFKESFRWNYVVGSAGLSFDWEATLFAADPFYYDETESTENKTTSGTPYDWSHSYGGNFKVWPVITLTANYGGFSNFTLRNQTLNYAFTYTGAVAASDVFIADCTMFTLKKNGVSVLEKFSGYFWYLEVGSNSIRYEGGDIDISTVYRKRYL